ncbi:GAF domain-containing protein [Limibaculum sp. FT325]|uniref:GAF domain-containing protein n=1 Tax=Thermohalobaculum sediminis TaxID=2939436 RepID=UPI0020C0ECFB|nr:GAF domain-containing protein [Limibaculum sediminis]MCL5776412.1 GAF domain-containing protein [Limibaculum sediminis]
MDTSESDCVTGLPRRCAELEALLALDRERQRAASAVLALLDHSPAEVQRVLDTIAELAAELCRAEFAFVLLVRNGRLELASASNASDAFMSYMRANPLAVETGAVSGRAVLEGRTAHVADCTKDPDLSAKNYERLGGHRTILGVPLVREDVAIGVVTLMRAEVAPFSEREIELLETFAAQAVIAINNAELFENVAARNRELAEASEQRTATGEILRVISSSPTDLDPVFRTMAEHAARLCDATDAQIFRLDDGGLRLRASYGALPLHGGLHPVNREWVTGRAVVDGVTVHVEDLAAAGEEFPLGVAYQRRYGHRTTLATPLMRGDEALGAILIRRLEVRPFTDRQIGLLEAFADQAVIAINNVELFEKLEARTGELQQALDHQTATAEVLRTISRSALDLQTVLDALTSSLVRLCDVDLMSIMRREGDVFHYVTKHGITDEQFEILGKITHRPGCGSLVGMVLESRSTVHLPDVLREPRYTFHDVQRLLGYRSMLGVPMLRDGEVIGVLNLRRREVQPFSLDEIRLVESFADQAVIAINNAELFHALRERTEELQDALRTLEVTSQIQRLTSLSVADAQPVFEAIVENAVTLCDGLYANVFRYDGEFLHFVATRWNGHDGEALKLHQKLLTEKYPTPPDRSQVAGRAVLSGKTICIDDTLADAEYDERFRGKRGWRRVAGVPMMREGVALGVIVVGWAEPGPIPKRQQDLLEGFADQALIAIENARLFHEVESRTLEVQQALEYQTATSEVLAVISRATDELQPVLDTIVATSCRLCRAGWAVIFRLLDDGLLHCVAGSGGTQGFLDYVASRPRPVDRGSLVGRAVLDAGPVHVKDVLEDPEYRWHDAQQAGGYRTALAVPLMRGGTVLGVIALQRNVVEPFSAVEVEAVTTFADQAVIAIGNVGLFQEVQARTEDLQEALDYQTATSEVLETISRSPGAIGPVLDAIVGRAASLCNAADCAVFLRESEGLRLSASKGTIPRRFDRLELSRETVLGRAVLDGRPVEVVDLLAAEDFPTGRALAREAGVRTVLAVPLIREGQAQGVISLRRTEVQPFSREQVARLQTFADQAAIAIENARLFGELEARTGELAASLENLRTTQDRLIQTEKLASLGQLTAGIAHEIKNPLNFVNNFATLSSDLLVELAEFLEAPIAALDQTARDEAVELFAMVRDNLAKIAHHGARADSIVKNMLQHARHGAAEWRMADVNALVEEALNLAYHGARAEHPDFTVEIARSLDPGLGQIECCPQDLTRVILNLVSNGIYAANRKRAGAVAGFTPRLDISTRNAEDGVEIEVRDNGSGIPVEIRDRIFLPFFTTKPAGEGTGLGLSISHDIVVEQHGGTFTVESEPGSFTLFRVTLPRTAGNREARA